MAKWAVDQFWKGEDAFVIGGGPSLRDFDWGKLEGKNTIGCNQAYELGASVCQYCFFGDIKFFEYNKHKLQSYEGTLLTSFIGLYSTPVEWIKTLKRIDTGLSADPQSLAWNGNSGASAINFALLAGAPRVFLLGFDNKDQKGENNWHNQSVFEFHRQVHEKHRKGLTLVAEKAEELFPDSQIINLNPDSALECFAKGIPQHYL